MQILYILANDINNENIFIDDDNHDKAPPL
ncbi:hypothetical protein PEPS_14000 [Persicobacter psychrovividus]|uniref:Uncharacterized protein n=1 Tax=Persicobacter psychrovividus TaxID=387638 RepID=A0ABM7VDT0_9BACT|nr:hypothetical protein PEPS_14000 [Persicobacter psychrovividus]